MFLLNCHPGSYYPSYASWMSYGTSLIGTVVENLQIEINSVHIRYEDDTSVPGRPFAAGFYLESLAAQGGGNPIAEQSFGRFLGIF